MSAPPFASHQQRRTPLPSFTEGCVTIRPWESADAPALAASLARSYRHMRPFVYWATRNVTESGAAARIAEWRRRLSQGTDLQFGVWVEDELLGGVGFQRWMGADRSRAEICAWVDAAYAGSGWGTLACSMFVDWGFVEWGFDLLVISHLEENHAARRLASKIGFVRSDPGSQVVPRRSGVVEWHLSRQVWSARRGSV